MNSPSSLLAAFLIAILIYSCGNNTISTVIYNQTAEKIEKLEEVKTTPANTDSLLNMWMRLNNESLIKQDTVLSAKVKYNIGRLYGMRGNDSAELYIGTGLELIEPTAGNFEIKARLYNGLGNIRSNDSKEHQANYYYNKAATIVLADTTLNLSPLSRTIMLLSASQSNTKLFQFDLAQQMNKEALALSPLLPPGHANRQRALVQIIQTLNAEHQSADSIVVYLRKLETLHRQNPGIFDKSYLYECKIRYFEASKETDSLLHYQLLKLEIDKKKYEATPDLNVAIINLFFDYVNIGGAYVAKKNSSKAAPYFDIATRFLNQHREQISEDEDIIYKSNLASLYELQGKKQEALSIMNDLYDLQKAVYKTENTQAVAEMNTLYQLQTKDRSIQTLNKNIRINQLQLQQNRLWLVIVVLILVLLGSSFLFWYNNYRQRRVAQEKEKVLLQQQLLRTQMEPHFIFNTLAAVQSFVRLDKKEAAIKYLNRFSRLLRSSLELSRENLVPLIEEIETLENYLNLQQMRFENAFQYYIHQPQGTDWDAAMLPPMLIQPFVENALLHGIDLDSGEGRIDIRFLVKNDVLEVNITDSGKASVNPAEPAHKSLSGVISRERLSLLGKKANISLASAEGKGTIVILNIPISG